MSSQTFAISPRQCDRTLWRIATKMCNGEVTLPVHRLLSSPLFKYILTERLRHWKAPPSSFCLYVLLSQFIRITQEMVYQNRLPVIDFLTTGFESAVEGGAKSQFKKNAACCWLIISDKAPAEAALTPLKLWNWTKLKMSLTHDTISKLLAPLHSVGKHLSGSL